MANNFAKKAEKYTTKLDELAEVASCTSDLDGANGDMVRDTEGAGTVLLPKMTISGLGDYDRASGFPAGDVGIDWQPYKLRFDRGRSFEVDDMDNADTLEVVTLNMLGKFVRDKVVPEMDAVRLSAYASNAGTTVSKTIAKPEDALSAVKQAVPYRFGVGEDPDMGFATFDGMKVVTVPTGRFMTSFTLGADGFAPTKATDTDASKVTGAAKTAALALNFLLVKPEAVCQVKKTEKMRYFAPEVNQDKDAHKWQYRLYHDAFVLSEKKPLVYAHTAASA